MLQGTGRAHPAPCHLHPCPQEPSWVTGVPSASCALSPDPSHRCASSSGAATAAAPCSLSAPGFSSRSPPGVQFPPGVAGVTLQLWELGMDG